MTQATMQVLFERARSEARSLDASEEMRDRWYKEQLRRIEAQAEIERKSEESATKQGLIEKCRQEVGALLHPKVVTFDNKPADINRLDEARKAVRAILHPSK